MSTPVILEVAANGVTSRTQNPAVPREPKELAEDALACFAAGAAIVHTHTHEPALPPAEGAALYLEAYRPVLAKRPGALLYPTVAPGRTIEERYGHTALLAEAGAIRCAALDTGSVNLGASLPDGWPMPMDFVYTNSPNDIRFMAEVCRRHALGPSVAVFEPGFLRVVLSAEKRGALRRGACDQRLEAVDVGVVATFVVSIIGVPVGGVINEKVGNPIAGDVLAFLPAGLNGLKKSEVTVGKAYLDE
jgi:uncharacterized protein (DUF849 family)